MYHIYFYVASSSDTVPDAFGGASQTDLNSDLPKTPGNTGGEFHGSRIQKQISDPNVKDPFAPK